MADIARHLFDGDLTDSIGVLDLDQVGTVPFSATPTPPGGLTQSAGPFSDANYAIGTVALEAAMSGAAGFYFEVRINLVSFANSPVIVYRTHSGVAWWIQVLSSGAVKMQLGAASISSPAAVIATGGWYVVAGFFFSGNGFSKVWVYPDATPVTLVALGNFNSTIGTVANFTEGRFLTAGSFFVNGQLSDSLLADTEPATAAPGDPTDFAALTLTSKSIRASWTEGLNTDLTVVYISTTNLFSTTTIAGAVLSGIEQFDILDLLPSTQYFIWVVAFNNDGSSATVGSVTATTFASPTALLDQLEQHLIDEGIGEGATGWIIKKSFMPPGQDQAIVLFETVGGAPDIVADDPSIVGDTKYDLPGIQVRVRAGKFEYAIARKKIQEVFNALHAKEAAANTIFMYGTQSSPLPMGLDSNDRPELTWNFTLMREREE